MAAVAAARRAAQVLESVGGISPTQQVICTIDKPLAPPRSHILIMHGSLSPGAFSRS
jgi:hypothetical protein